MARRQVRSKVSQGKPTISSRTARITLWQSWSRGWCPQAELSWGSRPWAEVGEALGRMGSEAFWCHQGPDKKHVLELLQNTDFRNGYKFSEMWGGKKGKRRGQWMKHTQASTSTHVHVCVLEGWRNGCFCAPHLRFALLTWGAGEDLPRHQVTFKTCTNQLSPPFAKYQLTTVRPVTYQKKEQAVTITIKQGYNKSGFKTKAFSLFFPHSVSKYTFPAHYCKSFEFQHTMSPAL